MVVSVAGSVFVAATGALVALPVVLPPADPVVVLPPPSATPVKLLVECTLTSMIVTTLLMLLSVRRASVKILVVPLLWPPPSKTPLVGRRKYWRGRTRRRWRSGCVRPRQVTSLLP